MNFNESGHLRKGAKVEECINRLISEMTVEEKVGLCHGVTKFTSGGVPRLGIEGLSFSDGPHGVREEFAPDEWKSLEREEDRCTYLPTGSALCATWNRSLARLHGTVLGSEARARGKDVILGPSVNIVRQPLCGRNFEYMSEDAYLASSIASENINGIQSEDVSACVKHFIMNNQENGRNTVDVDVDEKTLREVYLRVFQGCLDSYSFMGSYNKFRSEHCCHNSQLINGVLKGEWGYDGVFVSDWYGAHDSKQAIYNGLDVEMGTEHPYDEYFLANPFIAEIKENPAALEILNDKVRRILRLAFRIGKFDSERKKGEMNTPAHGKAAYDIASEAMVLLKNDLNVLPVETAPKTVLVIGENAVREHAHGGGSSSVMALYEVTLLDGIKKAFPTAKVEYITAAGLDFRPIPVDYLSIADTAAGCRAFKCETFENSDYTGKKTVEFKGEISDVETKGGARVFVGELNIPKDGDYYFKVTGSDGVRVYMGNEAVCELDGGKGEAVVHKKYRAGEKILIIIKVKNPDKTTFGWSVNEDTASSIGELCDMAKRADLVFYCGGLNHNFDSESFDRKNMKLPDVQNREIEALLDVRPDTVLILTAGSPVEMDWIEKAHTVLWTWYAGLEGGNVLCDIITGKVNPSGKLPVTFPVKYEDSPCARCGDYNEEKCFYKEGSLVGYRGFEHDGIKPLFPFGHGLSYTDFAYSDLSFCKTKEALEVSFSLENIGERYGLETVQVYFAKKKNGKNFPKVLAGFEKIALDAGEKKRVTVEVRFDTLSEYDVSQKHFVLPVGEYEISVGASSDDIRLCGSETL